jgi:Putative metal-binding motif
MRSAWVGVLVVGLLAGCSAAGNDETGGVAGGGGHVGGGSGASSGAGGSGGGINLGGTNSGGAAGSSSGATNAGGTTASGGSGACQSNGNNGWAAAGGGGPEQCGNGLDDDLNGFVDEGCTCAIGATQPCYGGPPGLGGKGACVMGTQTCSGNEFGQWGPCTGWVAPSLEICEGSVDEDCDGQVDQACVCCEGDTEPCGVSQGICTQGTQTCINGAWGACNGATLPQPEICGNGLDEDCDGQIDDGCTLDVDVNIDGDCVTASCPPQAPYAVGCNIVMSGGDNRGCVANDGGPVVYFQEGDKCGAGHVSGTLKCSSQPGGPLNAGNCPINKSQTYYPQNSSGCPAT